MPYYPHFKDEVTKACASTKTCLKDFFLRAFPSQPAFLILLLTLLFKNLCTSQRCLLMPPDQVVPPHLYCWVCLSESTQITRHVQDSLKSSQAWVEIPTLLCKALFASKKTISTTHPWNLTSVALQELQLRPRKECSPIPWWQKPLSPWSLLQIIPDPLEYDPINPVNIFAPSSGHLNGHPGNQTYRKAQTLQNIAICFREKVCHLDMHLSITYCNWVARCTLHA